MLKRGARIGILGGGQLGRMLAIDAYRLGFEVAIFEPSKKCPAGDICTNHIIADFSDRIALNEFAKSCDVITYEFENIPLETAQFIETIKPLYPNSGALELTQDRLIEKQFLNSLGLKTAPFYEINCHADLIKAIKIFGFPAFLKTRRMGYDGKGQFLIKSEIDLKMALDEIGNAPAVLEGAVQFGFETSIILVRATDGSVAYYTNPQNIHENGILRKSKVPAPISNQQIEKAREIGKSIADSLNYVGVMAVELFVGEEIIVNEIAPRVHNSGHWTIEGARTSQFSNHIRAICGLALGDTSLSASNIEMTNLLGDEILKIPQLIKSPNCFAHDYGKIEIKAGRKMGHVTKLD